MLFQLAIAIPIAYISYKVLTRKPAPKKDQDHNVITMVDDDIDMNKSILSRVVFSENGAFSRPTEIFKQISKCDPDRPIKIILETNGGSLVLCERIIRRLLLHPAGYIVYIRNACYSCGTLLALGAKEIVMDEGYSSLGKIDPQQPENSIHQVVIYTQIEDKYIDSRNIAQIKYAQNVINYIKELLTLIFNGRDEKIRSKVEENMLFSHLPHEKSFSFKECEDMGLPVRRPTADEKTFFNLP